MYARQMASSASFSLPPNCACVSSIHAYLDLALLHRGHKSPCAALTRQPASFAIFRACVADMLPSQNIVSWHFSQVIHTSYLMLTNNLLCRQPQVFHLPIAALEIDGVVWKICAWCLNNRPSEMIPIGLRWNYCVIRLNHDPFLLPPFRDGWQCGLSPPSPSDQGPRSIPASSSSLALPGALRAGQGSCQKGACLIAF